MDSYQDLSIFNFYISIYSISVWISCVKKEVLVPLEPKFWRCLEVHWPCWRQLHIAGLSGVREWPRCRSPWRPCRSCSTPSQSAHSTHSGHTHCHTSLWWDCFCPCTPCSPSYNTTQNMMMMIMMIIFWFIALFCDSEVLLQPCYFKRAICPYQIQYSPSIFNPLSFHCSALNRARWMLVIVTFCMRPSTGSC